MNNIEFMQEVRNYIRERYKSIGRVELNKPLHENLVIDSKTDELHKLLVFLNHLEWAIEDRNK